MITSHSDKTSDKGPALSTDIDHFLSTLYILYSNWNIKSSRIWGRCALTILATADMLAYLTHFADNIYCLP